MDVEYISEDRKTDWESFIRENPDAIAWQSYAWRDVLMRHYRFDFYPLAAVDAGRIVGVLPLYRVRIMFGKEALISVPHAVAGGIVSAHRDASRLLVEKAMELSRNFNSCGIVLKQYKVRMEGEFVTDGNYYNRELGISRDLGETLGKFSDRNREMLERAAREPFTLEYPSTDLNRFFHLLLRHLHSRGIPCPSRRWIEDLLRFKMYSIALLKRGGRAVAGTLVKEFKKTVSFPFTCLGGGNQVDERCAYRMYWDLIQHYHGKGFEIFHSGRIPNNDATDGYRLGWGGTKYGYYYQYHPTQRAKTEYASRRGRKREVLERCWKLLPRFVAATVGPWVVRQFP